MIVKLNNNSSRDEINEIFELLNNLSIAFQFIENENVIVLPKFNDVRILNDKNAIDSVFEIDTPFQLPSKIWKAKTAIKIDTVEISMDTFTVMAGPCSVENEDQVFSTAEFLSKAGIQFIRGGAYKPRTSPYSFRGLGVDGLKILHKAAQQFHLKVVTEILDLTLLDDVYQYADILQVGSRNMHNFYLLNELGKIDKPILLKRGMNAKVYEWLLAAEYILSGGNSNVILCERGIRSFDPQSRNVMDIGAISLIKELSHLPIIADPSHGTGIASRVKPAALAATAAGADGLIIEIHPEPAKALSDKEQALNFNEFTDLMEGVNNILPHLPYGKKTLPINNTVLNLQSI
ncbi:MAG: 3-deoxy-7-phosphoheptulonate synthase [Bacteroidota bacterium]